MCVCVSNGVWVGGKGKKGEGGLCFLYYHSSVEVRQGVWCRLLLPYSAGWPEYVLLYSACVCVWSVGEGEGTKGSQLFIGLMGV